MICPSCGSEYREGYRRCAECDVDLVHPDSPDVIETESKNELIRIFDTQNHGLLDEISWSLENEAIPYLTQSGTAFDAAGVVHKNESLIWRGALWVPEEYQEQALQIIHDVESQLAQAEHVEPQE